MKIKFLGTRGNSDIKNTRHKMHSSTLFISNSGNRLLIDLGKDWFGKLHDISPDSVLLTHSHPDHAGGLTEKDRGIPIYMTRETYLGLNESLRKSLEIKLIIPGKVYYISEFPVVAYNVKHSLVAPAVCFKIGDIIYAPDVAQIVNRKKVLNNINLYIGDGASLRKSLYFVTNKTLVGHASIATQLLWCQLDGIKNAIFTHCGNSLMQAKNEAEAEELGRIAGINCKIAYDGMEVDYDSSGIFHIA